MCTGAELFVVSTLLSGASSAIQANQSSQSSRRRSAMLKEEKEKERAASIRENKQSRERDLALKRAERGVQKRVEDIQAQEKGITPSGSNLSDLILNKV